MFGFQFLILLSVIIFYYLYFKKILIYLAAQLSTWIIYSEKIPKKDLDGVIELTLIALSHVGLVFCLGTFLGVPMPSLHVTSMFQFVTWLSCGILLGVGCMSVSALICQMIIITIDFYKRRTYDLAFWLRLGRGGWIKHHLQSLQLLPIYLSCSILMLQVGSEEVIFRHIIPLFLTNAGVSLALSVSCGLFILMQVPLMQSVEAAVFAMIGATVMGIAHGLIYLKTFCMIPLLVSHIVFFLFSVL